MENIGNFLREAEEYGCARGDLFQTVYLTDNTDMGAVIGGIFALGRKVRNLERSVYFKFYYIFINLYRKYKKQTFCPPV